MTQLARRIRALRDELGMDQRTFARKLGVSRFTVSRWENAANDPLVPQLRRMAVLARKRLEVRFVRLETDAE